MKRYITDHRKDPQTLNDYLHVMRMLPENVETIMELGVDEGGSLKLWNDMLAPDHIIGCDINIKNEHLRNSVIELEKRDTRITLLVFDQANKDSINEIREVLNYVNIDMIIDDCTHYYKDQIRSLRALWDLLVPGGLYVIEDWQIGTGFGEQLQYLYLELDAAECIIRKSMIVFVKGR